MKISSRRLQKVTKVGHRAGPAALPPRLVLLAMVMLALIGCQAGHSTPASQPPKPAAVNTGYARGVEDHSLIEQDARQDPSRSGVQAQLQAGYAAFEREHYKTALSIFESLNRQILVEDLRREILYGLACSRLALADNPDAIKQALVVWKNWQRLNHAHLRGEDPRMMGPFLQTWIGPEDTLSELADRQTDEALRTKEQEIERLQKLLRKKEEELSTLKHQLEGLETIEQNIQEKKKEVSSP